MRLSTSSIFSITSSFIEPIKARCSAVFLSSNFGQSMPGVSRSSTCLLSLIHCLPFVTPGLLPVFVTALPANELIKVDLPTLGIPPTMALTGRLSIPLALSLAILASAALAMASFTCFIPLPLLELSLTAIIPSSVKCLTQFSVSLSSAISALFSIITLDLPAARLSISGFLELIGMRASTSSITISISFISSFI